MRLKNGRRLDRFCKDSTGERGYVFWIEDSYFPEMVFVRGENFSDAYDWFQCDPKVEYQLTVREEDCADYVVGWDGGKISWEVFGKFYENCKVSGCDYNDNGVLIDTESIHGVNIVQYRGQFGLGDLGRD